VVESNPIELGAEIALHLRHQVSGECRDRRLGRRPVRHDESEVVAITFTAIDKGVVVSVVVLRIEHPACGALALSLRCRYAR
jgi:hypothetical protein